VSINGGSTYGENYEGIRGDEKERSQKIRGNPKESYGGPPQKDVVLLWFTKRGSVRSGASFILVYFKHEKNSQKSRGSRTWLSGT
jgi:hypothetical protein